MESCVMKTPLKIKIEYFDGTIEIVHKISKAKNEWSLLNSIQLMVNNLYKKKGGLEGKIKDITTYNNQ